VAQIASSVETSAEWTARTPPKRQVEGSNPSEPASVLSLVLTALAQMLRQIPELI
jgi:hypothetical protein